MSPTKVAEPVGNRALGEAQIPGEWAILGGRVALWCSLSLKFFDYLFAFTSHLPSAVWTATSSDEQSQFSPTSSLVCAQMLTMWNIYCLPQTSFRTQSVYLICFTHSGNTLQSFFQAAFNAPSSKLQRLRFTWFMWIMPLYKCFYLLTYLLTDTVPSLQGQTLFNGPCLTANTRTHLTALFLGLPGWAGTRKVKPIWILLKQETVSGSGICWTICKSASRSRQITTPAPTTHVC